MTQKINRLVSRAELVRRVSCHKSYTYEQCKEGGILAAAMVAGKVDLEHPAAYAFCKKYGYAEPDTVAAVKSATVKPQQAPTAPKNEVLPPDDYAMFTQGDEIDSADAWLDMSLREIVTRFGTQPQFKDFVASAKTLIGMRGLEEEQARKRGEYIHRSRAEQLIEIIDTLNKVLLNDAVINMASTTEALVKSGAEKREVETAMRDVITRSIQSAKAQTVRVLRNG